MEHAGGAGQVGGAQAPKGRKHGAATWLVSRAGREIFRVRRDRVVGGGFRYGAGVADLRNLQRHSRPAQRRPRVAFSYRSPFRTAPRRAVAAGYSPLWLVCCLFFSFVVAVV